MAYSVQLRWQPEAAIRSLSEPERTQVEAALERLRGSRLADVPMVYKVRARAGESDFYVLRVNESLRLLFAIDDDQNLVIVHDLVSTQFARRYG